MSVQTELGSSQVLCVGRCVTGYPRISDVFLGLTQLLTVPIQNIICMLGPGDIGQRIAETLTMTRTDLQTLLEWLFSKFKSNFKLLSC